MFLKRCIYDTASYKKGAARNLLFTALRYDNLILNNEMKIQIDKRVTIIHVSERKHKLIKKVPGTM